MGVRTEHIAKGVRTEHIEKEVRTEHIEKEVRTEHIEKEDRTEHIEKEGRTEHIEKEVRTEHIAKEDRTEHFTKTSLWSFRLTILLCRLGESLDDGFHTLRSSPAISVAKSRRVRMCGVTNSATFCLQSLRYKTCTSGWQNNIDIYFRFIGCLTDSRCVLVVRVPGY
jgi:hypothetical protein